MTSIDVFLFGMPVVLAVGGAVTVYFARRAAADIQSHTAQPTPTVHTSVGSKIAVFRQPSRKTHSNEAA